MVFQGLQDAPRRLMSIVMLYVLAAVRSRSAFPVCGSAAIC